MVVRRTASRASSKSESKSSGKAVSASYRGSAGRRQMEEEQRRSAARDEMRKARSMQPFRFWVPQGETRQIVVVDAEPDFFRYEHALKDKRTGRYDVFVPCIDEHANCGACKESDKPSYFAMYLTIIDLTPYENAEGDEVEWSKKLLVVKPAQQKKINRLFEKHGTLRGMILDMTRDGKKDAAIGNDIEFVEFMDDDELESFVTEYTDKDGKTHEVIGYEPYDYDELFPDMTEEQLNKIAGITRRDVGNRDDDDRELGRSPRRLGRRKDEDEEEEEEKPSRRRASRRDAEDEEEKPTRSRRGRREEADEEEEEDDRPARGRSGKSATAPRKGRVARDEEPEEEEEDDKPARPARTTRRAKDEEDEEEQRPARGRRAQKEEPEDEEEEEQRPARGSRSRRDTPDDVPFDGGKPAKDAAARRAQLRGRR